MNVRLVVIIAGTAIDVEGSGGDYNVWDHQGSQLLQDGRVT